MDYVICNGKILSIEENASPDGSIDKESKDTATLSRYKAYQERLTALSGREGSDK